jgi:hypothetical protein
MDFLPTEDEREWVLESLRELIEQRGLGPLLAHPLVEPSDEFYPDPWSQDGDGVWRLAQRTLWYADLDALDAVIRLVKPTDMPDEKTLGLFAGIEERRCNFTVSLELVDAPERLVAVLAHECAHAYREFHGLGRKVRLAEEALTDLTAVYLGFGVLTLNASYRYRAWGEMRGFEAVTRWTHETQGYLSPQVLAFALATVVVIRDLDPAARDRILERLEPNQRAYLKKALAHLGERRAELLERLRIPPASEWPAPDQAKERQTRQLTRAPLVGHDETRRSQAPAPPPNQGQAVFRIRRGRGVEWALRGFGVGLALFIAMCIWTSVPGLGVLLWGIIIAISAGYGADKTYDVCSDPECNEVLSPEAKLCQGCGGTIAGRINAKTQRQQFEAKQAAEAEEDDADESPRAGAD